jgi:uncharacterized protein (DUF433 family)
MSTSSEPVETVHPHVERRDGVQGGRPVIKGTRFPVSSIVQNYRRGLSVDDILREFPHLTPAQVHDALSYYYDNQAQVDQEIKALDNVTTWRTSIPDAKNQRTSRPDEDQPTPNNSDSDFVRYHMRYPGCGESTRG